MSVGSPGVRAGAPFRIDEALWEALLVAFRDLRGGGGSAEGREAERPSTVLARLGAAVRTEEPGRVLGAAAWERAPSAPPLEHPRSRPPRSRRTPRNKPIGRRHPHDRPAEPDGSP
ncbi:hypothetical protein [Streptomyces sp. NPDC048392]|uniref:hypothetical protein n=1 Tax=Streptomyces sp. NPDC048392 TaxID=3365543 RepID=UPI00370FDA68